MSKNLAWLLIIIGGICEIFWVSGLKYADTLGLQALTGLGICISFVCMLLAIRAIEISVAYSVFVGIGAAGGVIVGVVFYKEDRSLLKLLCVCVIIAASIGLKAIG